MGARRSGREAALQMLFQLEASDASIDDVVHLFWRSFQADPEGRPYADALVRGIAGKLDDLDTSIRAASTNWRLERMTRVDRNLLRLGAYELLFTPETPRAVVLDEAVELAKSYGTESSSAFINGVLVRVADDAAARGAAAR